MPEFHDTFDPVTLTLRPVSQGVEASAGTGKTYSIAILALRLILEKNIPVTNILMVTFTRAAVAELESRVRSFIREALEIVKEPNGTDYDKQIITIVEEQIKKSSRGSVEKILTNNVQLLDDTAVLTIHGFCQRVLREFSFETTQAFGTGLLSTEEYGIILNDEFHDYWREKIIGLHPDILTCMFRTQTYLDKRTDKEKKFNFSREIALELVRSSLSGKKNLLAGSISDDFLSERHQSHILSRIQEVQQSDEQFKNLIIQHSDRIESLVCDNKNAQKSLAGFFTQKDWNGLLNKVYEMKGTNYVAKVLGPAAPFFEEFTKRRDRLNQDFRLLTMQIPVDIVAQLEQKIARAKDRLLSTTFDDLIVQVRKAVTEGPFSEKLRVSLRNQYRAVFIDEFQDTDRDQYQIFKSVFGSNHFLYFIGDPKQSIYGWRKADLNAYFSAVDGVDQLYRMNTNYRSSRNLISAMNTFFKPVPDFDTFLFGDRLPYYPVQSPGSNSKSDVCFKKKPLNPILISNHTSASKIKAICALISQLVWSGDYQIGEGPSARPIELSDIGILVRTGSMGKKIKKALAEARIPAVTVDDTKVLMSSEAGELYYILTGIFNLSRKSVNRAMLTRIAGFDAKRLSETDEEQLMMRFRKYQETWKSKGIYVMLQQFMADHDLHNRFYQTQFSNAERIIANVMQLTDLLHRLSVRKKLDMAEQIQWLKKGMEGDIFEGDEYVQRIESDEKAVKIVTIHKSKGLEYRIVICPELDFEIDVKSLSQFTTKAGEHVVGDKRLLNENEEYFSAYHLQQAQETLRLIYVAITRASSQCFILNKTNLGKDSPINRFIQFLQLDDPESMVRSHDITLENISPEIQEKLNKASYSDPAYFNLTEKYWMRASFSRLTPEHQSKIKGLPTASHLNEYDQFVFRKLRKGAVTGTLLHSIFERINFANSQNWDEVISRMTRRYSPRSQFGSDSIGDFDRQLRELIYEVIHTQIIPGENFTLAEIDWKDRLTELEFDLDLKPFNLNDLQRLAPAHAPFRATLKEEDSSGSRSELEGLMNGLMDLFFEWNGKFYILDWKSNHLGDQLSDYSRENLELAMAENNYHLQYHLYTAAVCRYLDCRISDFDFDRHFGGVIYLFLRGIRRGNQEGMYFTRPNRDVIERINLLFEGKSSVEVY